MVSWSWSAIARIGPSQVWPAALPILFLPFAVPWWITTGSSVSSIADHSGSQVRWFQSGAAITGSGGAVAMRWTSRNACSEYGSFNAFGYRWPQVMDTLETFLGTLRVPLGSGGSRIVLAFAEPRAWKGRAGFGDASRGALKELVPGSDLTVLFGHPRLVGEIPGEGAVLVAWHRQRLMQAAVGRWLSERSR